MLKYYNEEDLKKIKIENFADRIKKGVIYYSNELIDNPESEFVLYDADVFRQGVCQLFAYALQLKFNYKVYILKGYIGIHIFCKSYDETEYIDVRGRTKSFAKFINGLDCVCIKDTSEEYCFSKDDFNENNSDIGIAFAKEIIESDINRYKCRK